MIHNEEANVTFEGHERERAGEIVVYRAGVFVGKYRKTEHIRVAVIVHDDVWAFDQLINIIVFLVVKVVIRCLLYFVVIVVKNLEWIGVWHGRIASRAADALAWSFHMTLCGRRTWIEIFRDVLCSEVWAPPEETSTDCFG